MAAASECFKSYFGSQFEEGWNKEVVLKEFDGPMLKLIIDFCYTGRVAVTEANVNDIRAAASSLKLTALEQKIHGFAICFAVHEEDSKAITLSKYDEQSNTWDEFQSISTRCEYYCEYYTGCYLNGRFIILGYVEPEFACHKSQYSGFELKKVSYVIL